MVAIFKTTFEANFNNIYYESDRIKFLSQVFFFFYFFLKKDT